MNKTMKYISNQSGMTIRTLNPNPVAQAFIYCLEQRAKVVQLIQHGFLPHHTSVGVGKTGKDHWKLEKYCGKFGKGFKMLTTSPFSTNFNHITYFTIAYDYAKHVSGIVGHDVEPTVKAIDEALEDYMEEHKDEDIFYSFHDFTVVDD